MVCFVSSVCVLLVLWFNYVFSLTRFCLFMYLTLKTLASRKELLPNGLSHEIEAAKRSYYSLCALLDLLKWEGRECDPDELDIVVKRYLRDRIEAYGEKNYQPKLHFCLHFATFARRYPLVPCWVHERKHKEIKRFSTDACNASSSTAFELGIMKQVTLVQVNSLKDLTVGECFRLINPGEASDALKVHVRNFLKLPPLLPLNLAVGMCAFVNASTKCHSKDVILAVVNGVETIGEVWFLFSVNGNDYVCWSAWETRGDNRFGVKDEPSFLPASCIKRCCIHRKDPDGNATVVP